MRGLHLENEAYVESKQPKNLVEALKFAQIYDDISRRSKKAFGKGKERTSSQRRGNSSKRKGVQVSPLKDRVGVGRRNCA